MADAVFAMVANRLVAACSKRGLPEWTTGDVVMPHGWSPPSLDQYYRALDAVADTKAETEEHLYRRLCDLTNLNLRLVCYDLTCVAVPCDRPPQATTHGWSQHLWEMSEQLTKPRAKPQEK